MMGVGRFLCVLTAATGAVWAFSSWVGCLDDLVVLSSLRELESREGLGDLLVLDDLRAGLI